MPTVLIENNYQVQLPAEIQKVVPVGTRLQISIDETGRIILAPEPDAAAVLRESFGMWANRRDLPADGVAYVDDIRRGQRLDEWGIGADDPA
jgi:bifunctional DNA-binding transcriptional regulator/antitoxin component of YhaV-PrlF toxin-antitoxin module